MFLLSRTRGLAVSNSFLGFILLVTQTACNQNLPEAARNLNLPATTANLKDGLNSLSAGLDKMSKIDLVGINGLLAKNDDLRQQLEKIRTQIDSYGTGGVVVEIGRNSRVLFQIIGYRGAVTLDAWVDAEQPDSMFIRSAELVRQTGKYPSVSYNIATQLINETAKKAYMDNSYNHPFDDWQFLVKTPGAAAAFADRMAELRSKIDVNYQETVNTAFDALLKDSFSAPTPDSGLLVPQAIAHKFLDGGRHQVFVRVTPQGPDASGHWSFCARTYIEHPHGNDPSSDLKEEQIDVLTMNDRDYGSAWKQRLKPVQAAGFMVRLAKDSPK
jgi:hypothetical protein